MKKVRCCKRRRFSCQGFMTSITRQNSQTQRSSKGDLLVFEKVIQRKLAKAERPLVIQVISN